MSSSTFLFLLHLIIYPFLIFFARADSDLIQKTCLMTNYFDVCIESLSSDPSSQDADVPGLASIVIQTTVADVSAASSFISSLLKNAKDPLLKRALQPCGKSYANANTSLTNSLQELSFQSYDYASVHVGAAMVYPRTCHDLFKKNPRLVYPKELADREEGVEHKCDVVLSIISLLVVA